MALRATKRAIRAAAALPPAESRALQREMFPGLWFSEDHKEAEAAFAERRPPVFKGR